jgi:hypothetical protein
MAAAGFLDRQAHRHGRLNERRTMTNGEHVGLKPQQLFRAFESGRDMPGRQRREGKPPSQVSGYRESSLGLERVSGD